ncbi:hypothetical protein [Streptomyces mangrovisoli]|uniref:Uncharacterized protein n=1 Tax=Streptomyces mangrovisoli TaxID=1428628 RepID=A0A1J4NR40_9ACTN|nr:hypothetical protein [Streptomyces mangrovisoli]OIJ63717.1 hypothetical protein WN71_033485 [Streptomyces mangrovisoli]
MTDRDPGARSSDVRDDALDALLARAHRHLGLATTDRITAQGGPPELRSPDLALDRLLAAAHRSVGSAVRRRRADEAGAAGAEQIAPDEEQRADRGPLSHRPSSVRVKYRQQALHLARRYWPTDLCATMRAAVRIVQGLSDLLQDGTQLLIAADPVLEQLRKHLREMTRLPEPQRRPVTLTGYDYLTAVEFSLAGPAERLLHDLHRIRRQLDEEFAPALATLGGSPYADPSGADAVAQDLADDLAHSCATVDALAKAVAEVERASSDFVGADLRGAKLDGVRLEGILWDSTTVWPDEWAVLIRKASLPAGEEQGVLVVAAEPSGTVIHADA